jgi:hypothetical protein
MRIASLVVVSLTQFRQKEKTVAEAGAIYFLGTSVVVKLYHQELGSEVVEGSADDPSLELWISELTRAEFHSVFVRKVPVLARK